MGRINTDTAVDKVIDGETVKTFTDGDVATGVPPTNLNAAWCNDVQETLNNPAKEAGLTVGTSEDENYGNLTKAIGVLAGTRRYGDIVLVDTSVQDAYLTKHGLVRLDGQTLSKTEYPKLHEGVSETWHKDKDNLQILSLGQSFRLAPKATATAVELPDIDISKTQGRSEYNEQGSFAAWNLFGTPTRSTRSNLIMWNRDRNRLAYVKDCLTTGATIVEVDLNNWTTPNTEWVVSGIGGQARNWRYLMYDAVTRSYILTYNGTNVELHEYRIEASTRNVTGEFPTFVSISGGAQSIAGQSFWFVTDGWKLNVFSGFRHDYANRTDNTSNFYNNNTQSIFAIGEDRFCYIDYSDNGKLKFGKMQRTTYFFDGKEIRFMYQNNVARDHHVLFNDEDNYFSAFHYNGNWELNFMIDGISRYELYDALHILGVCQNDDAYFILVADIATANAAQKHTAVHAYSKRRIGDPRMCIQT